MRIERADKAAVVQRARPRPHSTGEKQPAAEASATNEKTGGAFEHPQTARAKRSGRRGGRARYEKVLARGRG